MFTEAKMNEFTVGADPEVFLKRAEETQSYFWSAEGLIPGSKVEPFRVPYGAIQVDGLAAEFNILPVQTEQGFFNNISNVMKHLKNRVYPKFKLFAVPVAHFEETHYSELPEHCKELGCNPDWNAYTGRLNPTPQPPKEIFRTGAGHVHIGWGNNFKTDDPNLLEACCHLVKHMDTCVGKPLSSYTFLKDYENAASMLHLDVKRRNLYGDFGCFRPTSYGVEYRTLSNIWLNHPELVIWVYRQTMFAVKQAFKSTNYNYKVL